MPLLAGLTARHLVVADPTALFPPGPILPGLLVFDELSLLVGALVAGLTILLVLCSPATSQVFRQTTLSIFFLGITFVVITAANVVVFYLAWELAALFAWALGRLPDDSVDEGATPFSAAGALASLLMFAGLGLLVAEGRTVSLAGLRLAEAGAVNLLILAAIYLKAFGLLSEAWQRFSPGQFSLASATTAGASLVVVGLFPILRLFGPTAARAVEWVGPASTLAGSLAILAAVAALGMRDVRRVASYAALSQYSALVFALLAGPAEATLGALYGVVTYSLAATGLLLCAGLVEAATGERDLARLGGVAQQLPAVAVLFVLCAAALAGLPPFGSFVAYGLVGQTLWGQADLTPGLLWAALSVLTVLYLARFFGRVFLGELRGPVRRGTSFLVFAAVGLLLSGLGLAGVAPDEVLALVSPAWALLSA